MKRVEVEHWSGDPLDESVILFNDVVEVFGLNDINNLTNTREFEDDV